MNPSEVYPTHPRTDSVENLPQNNQAPAAAEDSTQRLKRTQHEVRRLNQESMAIIDALREQRRTLDTTNALQSIINKIQGASDLIRYSEKSHFQNRAIAVFGVIVWLAAICYILWGNPWWL